MDPSILRSLQEIASLLLLVHDDYLRDVFGNDILASLTLLLRDVGLSGVVSVLDSERLRSTVMGGSNGDMGYELFYDWLRGVGQLVYKGRDQTGKKALHFLLTRYVIPFVSKTDDTPGESDTAHKVELPFFTDAALKVLVDNTNFVLLLFSEIANEYPASVLASNMNLWQQISSSTGKGNVSPLSVLGTFTKYSVVPDLITEDELESTMMLASSSSDASTDTIQFPTFLYLLELVAETLSETKLMQRCNASAFAGGTETSRKLASLLCILGMNMLQRRAFKFMSLGEGEATGSEVTVFDEDALYGGSLTSGAVLWWLRQAGAITLPHIQIPSILGHLSTQSAGGDHNAEGTHNAAGIEKIIHSTVNFLSNGTSNGSLIKDGNITTAEVVGRLMKQLPALFFADPDLQPPASSAQAALRCLYSLHTAPLLRDFVSELEASMTATWTALMALQASDAASLDVASQQTFTERFGTATVRIHTLLEFIVGKGFVPTVLSSDTIMQICGAVMGEQASTFTEESVIHLARLFEALYGIAHDHWSALENIRRRRPAGTSGLRLSVRQPQRAQQIFQTFLFLVHHEAPAASEVPAAITASVQAALEQASKPEVSPLPAQSDSTRQSVEGRITGIPVPVASKRPLPALDTDTGNSGDDLPVMTPLTASVKQLTVSFNSRKHTDGSPVRSNMQRGPGSLFANHPLRDIAVLLLHYPQSSFALNPWSVTHLLLTQADDPSAGQSRHGIAEENSRSGDRQLTDLLRKFCAEYGVSSVHLSEYFALYYLPVDNTREAALDGAAKASSTLFKEQALRSEVIDLLMGEQAQRILMLNADLLKWQYARCLALYRANNDPFTSGTNAPLMSSAIMHSHPVHCLLPVSNALLWAVDCAGISSESAKLHMSQIACLTGNTVPALTFSTFIVFAVRCFCDTADSSTSNASEGAETHFIQTIRHMLQTFSTSLSSVQQALRMKLLRPLFGKVEDLGKDPLGDADVAALVTAALGVFNAQHINTLPSIASSPKAAPGDGRIPPRPPSMFWDAPRFVQLCRDLGLLCSRQWSAALCWDAYGVCLREEGASGVDLWEESVVPPVPVKASADLARKLLETALLVCLSQKSDRLADRTVVDAELTSMYYKSVAPILCASNDPRRLTQNNDSNKPKAIDGLRFEDLLRYGGSATMDSLSHARRFLQLAYYDLVVRALPTLMDLTGKSLHFPASASGRTQLVGEVPLSSVCRMLSCHELVRASAVAVHAKRSLQCRLRPVFFDRLSAGATAAGSSKLTELVTLSYEEFEELCVRIAFELWETSTAHLHAESVANKIVLLSQAHFAGKTVSPLTTKTADWYVEACIESNAERKRFSALKSGKLNTWGVDFFLPFRITLEKVFTISADVRAQFEAVVLGESALTVSTEEVNKAIILQAKKPKGSVRFDENQNQINGLQSSEQDEVMSTIFDKSLKYSIADPAVRRVNTRSSVTETPANPRFFSNSPLTVPGAPSSIPGSPSLPLPRESKDWERGSREPSPSPKLHTSQQVILSSTERFLLRQESSEQFVVALDALLVGTKEALWPVYATYCSCGDSLDPGKLSGPNLFTLLSKLGVLTDHTILSDVGILLHQTALHSLSSAPVDALTALYESGDYYDTPSLTFEEFIVFLCAFSQLRFEGVMLTQDMFRKRLTTTQTNYSPSKLPQNPSSRHSQLSLPSPTPENWFKQWQEFMGSSASFRRLLVECVLPILRKQTLLAFPEDARLRDRFCCVFSIEVLLAIEGVEGPLQSFFEHERARELQERQAAQNLSPTSESALASQSAKYDIEISAIMTALKRINLVPKVMGESQVLQLIKDVLPEETSKRRAGASASASASGQPVAAVAPPTQKNYLLFPQWEWVLSVVAFQAVETAMEQSPTANDHEKIPALVADVINSIASAITQN